MGEYEPNNSRNVTLTNNTAPGEPPRTGPREEKTRYESEEQAASQAARHAAGGQDPNAPRTPQSQTPGSEQMQQGRSEGERGKDQQAGAPQGLGYGTEDGEEMKDAPDLTQRGYGGAGQQRQDKL